MNDFLSRPEGLLIQTRRNLSSIFVPSFCLFASRLLDKQVVVEGDKADEPEDIAAIEGWLDVESGQLSRPRIWDRTA